MVRIVDRPEVFLISSPQLDWDTIYRYLDKVSHRTSTDCGRWADRALNDPSPSDGEALIEFAGRFCYRSWIPGANANVSKVRENAADYHANILASGHGSVLEHANYSFIFDDVSRVFTHEMVRHRAGVAVSQESMRYVRLVDVPFWFPDWAQDDEELMRRSLELLDRMEDHQAWMSQHFNLDAKDIPFSEKKNKTSFMRRFAPDGVSTGMICTINVRAMRHIIAMRTALSAEEEIRIVFDEVARLALEKTPNLMQDYSPNENQEWIPEFLKV